MIHWLIEKGTEIELGDWGKVVNRMIEGPSKLDLQERRGSQQVDQNWF